MSFAPTHRAALALNSLLALAGLRVFSPKLRPVRQVISLLTWDFSVLAGQRSGYVKVSGTGAPIRMEAETRPSRHWSR